MQREFCVREIKKWLPAKPFALTVSLSYGLFSGQADAMAAGQKSN
ncbi:MAG TPA: hypothetical protein VFD58_02005 [Blastocatellia bacterium]|nr:hypothetical protein [Blastocatellia bacterium]